MKRIYLSLIAVFATVSLIYAQNSSPNYLTMRWTRVANGMPTAWYGSEEAKRIAENVLISQRDIGGWEKNQPYHRVFSDSLKKSYISKKGQIGATFDNGATTTELKFLAKVYAQQKDERYREAFLKGLNYIFIAQYENGGWPQFYPVRNAANAGSRNKSVPYSAHITYNDDAMVNIMLFLKAVYTNHANFVSLNLDEQTKNKAKEVFNRGVDCILKSQIVVDNTPTVWCAQHDYKTLAPTKARSYELASFSGAESASIVMLLMDIEKPSKEIVAAVNGAVQWFENHKIENVRVQRSRDENGKWNTIVVEDKNAKPLWGRFHDLETGKIYFSSRDGVKKDSIDEIDAERRNGYSWYTNRPQEV
ncbi:pectate lyase, partial [Pseudoxanthomonas sp. SGD-10]